MATLNEKLQEILDIKNDIKSSIESKGGEVSNFSTYADAIDNLSTETVKEDKHIAILSISTMDSDEDPTFVEVEPGTDIENLADYVSEFYTDNGQHLFTIEAKNNGTKVSTQGFELADISFIDFLNICLDNWFEQNNFDMFVNATGMELVNRINELSSTYNATFDEVNIVESVESFEYGEMEEELETCPDCGSELEDGICHNPDCPSSPDYEEPEEDPEGEE